MTWRDIVDAAVTICALDSACPAPDPGRVASYHCGFRRGVSWAMSLSPRELEELRALHHPAPLDSTQGAR